MLIDFFLWRETHTVPEYELSSVRLVTKRSIDNTETGEENDSKHVHLNAFGQRLRLKLRDNSDFNNRIKDMKVFIAETSKNGKLRYHEDPSASVSGARTIISNKFVQGRRGNCHFKHFLSGLLPFSLSFGLKQFLAS